MNRTYAREESMRAHAFELYTALEILLGLSAALEGRTAQHARLVAHRVLSQARGGLPCDYDETARLFADLVELRFPQPTKELES
jgi:hypothetical protein